MKINNRMIQVVTTTRHFELTDENIKEAIQLYFKPAMEPYGWDVATGEVAFDCGDGYLRGATLTIRKTTELNSEHDDIMGPPSE